MHFIKRYCTSKCQYQEKHPLSHAPPHTHALTCTSAQWSDHHLLVLTCTQEITEQTSVQDVAHWISIFSVCKSSNSVLSTSAGWFVCKCSIHWHEVLWFSAEATVLVGKASLVQTDKMKPGPFSYCEVGNYVVLHGSPVWKKVLQIFL